MQGLQRCALLARRTDGLRHLVSCVSVSKTGAQALESQKKNPKLPSKYAIKAPNNSFCASSRIVKTECGRFSKCSQTLRAPAQMCSVWSLTSHRPLIRHSVRTTTVSPQLWLRHTSNMKETTPQRQGAQLTGKRLIQCSWGQRLLSFELCSHDKKNMKKCNVSRGASRIGFFDVTNPRPHPVWQHSRVAFIF